MVKVCCDVMTIEREQLETGIAALEAQRALLGDAVVNMALAPLKAKLASLGDKVESVQPEAARKLKQVSILFLDFVGSTALAQILDPEAISAVMDGGLARATAWVRRYHGTVLQYAGDSLLGAFGVSEVREDDAERAVHCGLALLELGKLLAAEVHAMHGYAGLDARIGIHTGGVLLGGGVDAEGTIRGLAVNIAARMEQAAPAGCLRISHDTYGHVRGLFEVDAQEPLAVKGVEALVQSYLVRRAKPRNFRIGTRGIEGVATSMIGRDAEFDALQAAFKRLFANHRFSAVIIVADAGIGKSRLQYEFAAWSESRDERFFLFRGRATPQTASSAFGLLRDILAWRFQISDDDSLEVARIKIEQGVSPLFLHDDGPELAEGHAHLLGHLIGIDWKDSRHIRGILDDPKQIRNRAFHAAAQIFRRMSGSGGATSGTPVVLQIEDLHWADDESLDFLNYLAEVDRDVPMLMVASTRPTLFERRADWGSAEGLHQRIELQPLGKDVSRLLANELLKKLREVPMALRELLVSSAEGNPFYMEELVKTLIDQGAIETGDRWQIDAQRLLLSKVPPTLTGVLQSRLDSLPAAERHALQEASIVGAVFWDQALAAVDSQAADQLPALVQRELTLPRPDAAFEGLREYAFRHQLLHQVTYDTVLKPHKREGHARVAQWLAGLVAQGNVRAGDFLGLAAEHYEQAGDAANAAEFHARAAEQGGARFAHDRVLMHVSRALELLRPGLAGQLEAAPTFELRWRLLIARERTLGLQARREEQGADLDELGLLAQRLDDDRKRSEVARRRGVRAMRMANWIAMEHAAREGLECALRAGEEILRLHAIRLLAMALLHQGDTDGARVLALQGLADARTLKPRSLEGILLNVLSLIADRQGDLTASLTLDQEGLQIHRESGDRVNEAIQQSNLGASWLSLGAFANARRELEASLRLLRANGDRVNEGTVLGNLSALALLEGDETRALTLARAALDIESAAQARNYEIFAGIRLSAAEVALGRLTAAQGLYAQALKRAAEIDSPFQHDARAGLAQVALAAGDGAAAIAALQPVLNHVAAGGSLGGTIDARLIELTCFQALDRVGDPRATDWLKLAQSTLMDQARAIGDPKLRQGFLENFPHHQKILAAWSEFSKAAGDPGPIEGCVTANRNH